MSELNVLTDGSCINCLKNRDPEKAYHGIQEDFLKLHCREAFTMLPDSHGFTNPARKKLRFVGRSHSAKAFSYQRIRKEESNVEPRRKSSKFRLYIKRKRWALRLPRARISPLVEMLKSARDCYMKLFKKMHQNPGIVFRSQWGFPTFYQPHYL